MINGQTEYSERLTLKLHMHIGAKINQVRVPAHVTREDVLAIIREEDPDMLYLMPIMWLALGGILTVSARLR